jgi:hypothetical protein
VTATEWTHLARLPPQSEARDRPWNRPLALGNIQVPTRVRAHVNGVLLAASIRATYSVACDARFFVDSTALSDGMPGSRRQYDQARMLGQHLGAEEVLEIAGGAIARGMSIPIARRLIDAKKWHLGRIAPKRRGPLPWFRFLQVTVRPVRIPPQEKSVGRSAACGAAEQRWCPRSDSNQHFREET